MPDLTERAAPRGWLALLPLLICGAPGAALAAELKAETVAAYEQHIARAEKAFAAQAEGALWLDGLPAETRARLRQGEIIGWPGEEDGILDAPDGLIHHWRGAAFIPEVTLEAVLDAAQDYPTYHRVYDWVIASSLLQREPDAGGKRDQFRAFLRIERSASVITSVVDVWTLVEYTYPRGDLAFTRSDADCVREVESAGGATERRQPVGAGRGYLWRANTFSTYLQRDGGVYVEHQTVGLSRGFPPLLGWIIEPIARRLGRGSAVDTLEALRQSIKSPASLPSAGRDPARVQLPTGWCGE